MFWASYDGAISYKYTIYILTTDICFMKIFKRIFWHNTSTKSKFSIWKLIINNITSSIRKIGYSVIASYTRRFVTSGMHNGGIYLCGKFIFCREFAIIVSFECKCSTVEFFEKGPCFDINCSLDISSIGSKTSCRQYCNNRDDDHQLDKGKTKMFFHRENKREICSGKKYSLFFSEKKMKNETFVFLWKNIYICISFLACFLM